ncbi:hypothetical protein [Desulfonatronum thioautotrophicum]|uniref:hypothetical protein n=1 Tax=Desulfonatronum thioautotrophicum TaxID=617001 RepID=UPI0012948523|nr:hypothetical protein [Desulfonatronum thioautotrophicum]
MNKTNYKLLLEKFKNEICNSQNSVFQDIEKWSMAHDVKNAVLIGYVINDQAKRILLHRIGLKFGLIPLCPGDVVDIDFSEDSKIVRSYVRTQFGKMQISP